METDDDRSMDYHGDPIPVSGVTKCEKCSEKGIGFNDDGEWLCEDCMFEWSMEEFGDDLDDEDF